MPKGISFSGEFKQKVIEDMHTNKLNALVLKEELRNKFATSNILLSHKASNKTR